MRTPQDPRLRFRGYSSHDAGLYRHDLNRSEEEAFETIERTLTGRFPRTFGAAWNSVYFGTSGMFFSFVVAIVGSVGPFGEKTYHLSLLALVLGAGCAVLVWLGYRRLNAMWQAAKSLSRNNEDRKAVDPVKTPRLRWDNTQAGE